MMLALVLLTACFLFDSIAGQECSCSGYDDCDVCYLGYFGSSEGTSDTISMDASRTCYRPYITITMYYIESYENTDESWTLQFEFDGGSSLFYVQDNILDDSEGHDCYYHRWSGQDMCYWGCDATTTQSRRRRRDRRRMINNNNNNNRKLLDDARNNCDTTFNPVITRLDLLDEFGNNGIEYISSSLYIKLYSADDFYSSNSYQDGDFSSTIELYCSDTGPSISPTNMPSDDPTLRPTNIPTTDPTLKPSNHPSVNPTDEPTRAPVIPGTPTKTPSVSPTIIPTASTLMPSITPSNNPSIIPTEMPISPTNYPSTIPSGLPTEPTVKPTRFPTPKPSLEPTMHFNHSINENTDFEQLNLNSSNTSDSTLETSVLFIILGSMGVLLILGGLFVFKYRKHEQEKLTQKAMEVRYQQMLLIKQQAMKDSNKSGDNKFKHAATIPMVKAGAHHKKNNKKALSVAQLMARKDVADKTEAKIRLIDPALFSEQQSRSKRLSIYNKDDNLAFGGENGGGIGAAPAAFHFNFSLLGINGGEGEGMATATTTTYGNNTSYPGGETHFTNGQLGVGFGGGGGGSGALLFGSDMNSAGEGGNDKPIHGDTSGAGPAAPAAHDDGMSLEDLERLKEEQAQMELKKRKEKELKFGQMLGDQQAVENAIFEDIVDDIENKDKNNNNKNKNALLDDNNEDDDNGDDNDVIDGDNITMPASNNNVNDKNNYENNNNTTNNNNNNNNNSHELVVAVGKVKQKGECGEALIGVDIRNNNNIVDNEYDNENVDDYDINIIVPKKEDEFQGALGNGAAVEDAIFDDIVEDMANPNDNNIKETLGGPSGENQ